MPRDPVGRATPFGIHGMPLAGAALASGKEAGPQDQLVLARESQEEGTDAIRIRTDRQARLRDALRMERSARWMAVIGRCVMKNPPLAAQVRGKASSVDGCVFESFKTPVERARSLQPKLRRVLKPSYIQSRFPGRRSLVFVRVISSCQRRRTNPRRSRNVGARNRSHIAMSRPTIAWETSLTRRPSLIVAFSRGSQIALI